MSRKEISIAESAAELCVRLSEGRSLRDVCKDEDMPSKAGVFKALQRDEVFREMYIAATKARAEAMAEDILHISDDIKGNPLIVNGDVVRNEKGEIVYQMDGPSVNQARLRVDTRKWLMSKVMPAKYGVDKEDKSITDLAREVMIEVVKASDPGET